MEYVLSYLCKFYENIVSWLINKKDSKQSEEFLKEIIFKNLIRYAETYPDNMSEPILTHIDTYLENIVAKQKFSVTKGIYFVVEAFWYDPREDGRQGKASVEVTFIDIPKIIELSATGDSGTTLVPYIVDRLDRVDTYLKARRQK